MSKQSPTETSSTVASPLTRRNLVAGAGAVGAAAAAAALLPVQPTAVPVATAAAVAEPAGEGYRLSEHVQRYYQTARV
ncbi:MAG TPA: formate dehydrogenase [Rubrivivax sp.]|nr:formate dehydrogenase [Rubrivivax sp.]